ncbi:MAG: FAD-binding oxidoreductase [Lachnospiraceae bacterium]|nr:FAD-binding oxidoreductase [Lachnospiraceae bacterium]
MDMREDLYREFEAIVGPRNISRDKSVLETYRCMASQNSAHYGPYKVRTPFPMAVLLPGSSEEVQKIIRLCNREGIHFKASSTFWSAQGYVSADNAVQLDLRRMDGVEIDAENGIAIIEPYAIAGVIQAEAMKYGYTCNIQGVGGSSSTVASTAGWQGPGPSSLFTGTNYDNLLACEWVLPNGEILRTGSLGSGDGWFCGEGPGPSLRAILRGGVGTAGDMGVCTKMAVKLAPWPGPDHLASRGKAPAYKADLPDNFRCYTLCFPDWEHWAHGVQLLHENRITYTSHRQFNMFGCDIKGAMVKILSDENKQLCDLPELLEDPEVKAATQDMHCDMQIVLAGMSEADLAYKEAALDEILRISGGHRSQFMAEKEIEDWALLYFIRMGRKNLNYVLCGSYEGHFGLARTNYYLAASLVEEASALKKHWEETTPYLAKVGGNSSMGGLAGIGGGGGVSWEFFAHFDSFDDASVKGVAEYFGETNKWMGAKGLGGCMGKVNEGSRRPDGYDRSQEELNKMFQYAPQPGVFTYQWKVREAFNPNHLTGTYYKTLEPSAVRTDVEGAASIFI